MAEKKSLALSPVKEGVIPVDEWEMEEADRIIKYAGKSVIIPFDELITSLHSDNINVFYVSFKDLYVKKFEHITHYMNYFLKYYDDGELIMNYLHCKFMIDSIKTNPSRKAFIRMIYKDFVTPSLYDKVMKMVQDNYRIDLAQNKDPGKEYSESREFTNEHAKILMLISTFIKFLIPLVMHYISVCKGKDERNRLIEYYRPLFVITHEREGIDLYPKLFNSIMIDVEKNEKHNKLIWEKYAVYSMEDSIAYTEELLNKNLIVDNMFKYIFNSSIISFNSVIIRDQLGYRCIKDFGMNMREISTEKDSDGLSYLDKLEMDMVKIDENNILLSKNNIKDTIKRIKKKLRIKVSKKERNFYIKNTKVNSLGKSLVFYYYCKIFGGFTDLNQIDLDKYMQLMILMKRRLQKNNFIYLSQLISANTAGKTANRVIHSNKLIERFQNSPTYQNFMKEKYTSLTGSNKEDPIISMMNYIMNTRFVFIDYDCPDDVGKILKLDYDGVAQELQEFISCI